MQRVGLWPLERPLGEGAFVPCANRRGPKERIIDFETQTIIHPLRTRAFRRGGIRRDDGARAEMKRERTC
jgi:hypothetical protein